MRTVVVNSVVGRLGKHPTQTVCPKCHNNIITNTTKFDGSMAWLWCFIIFLLGGGIFCLCFIPFCVDSFKDVRHSCPNCTHIIGTCSAMWTDTIRYGWDWLVKCYDICIHTWNKFKSIYNIFRFNVYLVSEQRIKDTPKENIIFFYTGYLSCRAPTVYSFFSIFPNIHLND